MAKTAKLTIRIDPEIKSNAEQLFSSLGMSVSEAVNVFLRQSLMVGGMPFEMKRPRFNATTEAAMREAQAIASGKVAAKSYPSAKDLFAELDG